MKKKVSVLLMCCLLFSLIGCKTETKIEYNKFSDSFFDTFDTLITVVGYTEDEEEFNTYFSVIQEGFRRYHQLFDRYNEYEGINNIKTINDNAGISPVKVEQEIIDLILFSKEWHTRTNSVTNIAFGPVLEIWHDYRTEGIDDPKNAQIPPMEELQAAVQYTNLNQIIVDTDNSTVFLPDKNMLLDVGAVAKGYATEMVVRNVSKKGMNSGIISAGGNVRTIGNPPKDKGEYWVIGLQNPDKTLFSDQQHLDAIFIKEASVVSSGDYQRYYYVGDQLLHHLIDAKTLMPASYYRAVTVTAKDSGVADFLSTSLFLLPFEESLSLVESIEGAEALWVMPDGEVRTTEGMKKMLKSHGATNQK
ncbi:FAD:protein FMN transferase [Alkaliphilus hydrothermalis]|uniref:FAD:protein FMN transferase n=1 Tax=Alkaliphilus hydrothermalis TaxID=1482730 RepID=A0ABS2NTC6_9FIRM|nr:FAD:protein FMN transferase [Alkaliphilus hydrothermalis]MBM7616220.1 thiamine biosynthesis lipoprotein [Alkaliphilus hydrothermalis]